MSRQRNIRNLLKDAAQDDFCMVLDVNVMMKYCASSLNKMIPRFKMEQLDPDLVAMIDTVHDNDQIRICGPIHNSFDSTLSAKISDLQYERAWRNLYKKYDGKVIADLRRGGCDYDEFQWPLELADSYMSEPIVEKFAQIEKLSMASEETYMNTRSVDDILLLLINCGYTSMILAFCMYLSNRSRVVIYTDYSDFADLKTDIEEDFDNIRMFSSDESFEYTRF